MATEATPGVGALVAAGLAPWAEGDQPTLACSEVQYVAIDVTDLGANTLVAAVAGVRTRVLSLVLVASGGANTVQIRPGGGAALLMGAMDLAADGQLVLPYNPAGWCQTLPGEPLDLELTNGTAVAGVLGYVTAD